MNAELQGQSAKEQTLLAEYREAMESQRNNTSLVYSWTGSIFLVLSSGMFYYGTTLKDASVLIPTMILALVLVIVWWGLTETFVFYIKQRMRRIHEIEALLNMKLMSEAGQEIQRMGFSAKFLEARSYVRLFIVAYLIVWILMLVMKL